MSFSPSAAGMMPVPRRRQGLVYGDKQAPIQVSFFADPCCPDCNKMWKLFKEVLKKVPQMNVSIFMLALPFHTWAYTISQVVLAVKELSEDKARDLLAKILEGDQEKFENEPLGELCQPKVTETIIEYAAKVTGLEKADIEYKYDSGAVKLAARQEFKYCAQQGVCGTPTIFVNGARTAINEVATVDELAQYFKSLFDEPTEEVHAACSLHGPRGAGC